MIKKFQIMHHHATQGRQKTPMHVMNAHKIYEKCKSRELITAFNSNVCALVINQ